MVLSFKKKKKFCSVLTVTAIYVNVEEAQKCRHSQMFKIKRAGENLSSGQGERNLAQKKKNQIWPTPKYFHFLIQACSK